MESEQQQKSLFKIIKKSFGTAVAPVRTAASYISSRTVKLVSPLIVRFLQPVLQWLQMRWRVIRPARVGLILSIAVSLFVLFNDQAKDILRVIAQEHWWNAINWMLCGGLIIYASTAWYFSRAVLYVFYESFTPNVPDTLFERLRKYTARFIGGLPIVALAFSFIGISWSHATFYFVVTGLFVWLLILRRKYLLPKFYKNSEQVKDSGEVEIYVGLHHDKEGVKEGLTSRTRPVVITIFVIALIVFSGILLMPVSFPTTMGTLGVIFLGAAGLVVLLNLLTYWTDYYDLPSLVFILFLTAIVAGIYNDNHAVRVLQDSVDQGHRQTLTDHFEKWMKARLTSENSKGDKYPVFVVAAEGGGIRAAYWTAAMLAELQRQYPDFPCHLFAISGVSGGSLGGSAYVSDLANAYRSQQFRCTESKNPEHSETGDSWKNKPIVSTSLDFLGEDFLAPTVGGLLFPDLISRVNLFCPWLFCFPDRAYYLEKAWEQGWLEHNKETPLQFSGDFFDLWAKNGELEIPSLLLNGTWVEDGRRNVTSNLILQAVNFTDVDDMLANFDQRIPLSTAVHMSARFTYVSPAGTVRTRSDGTKRVVDGGYFENSGALGARQVIQQLRHTCENSKSLSSIDCEDRVAFYGIIISNNPESPNAAQGAILAKVLPNRTRNDVNQQEASASLPKTPIGMKSEESEESNWFPVLSETLSPALALFNARTARGSLSETELLAEIKASHSLRFQLHNPPDKNNKIPLGWVLSNQTQDEIQDQAKLRVEDYSKKLQATGLKLMGK